MSSSCCTDFNVLAVCCRTTDVELLRDFFTTAQEFLPHLGHKPHVVVLDHPMDLVKSYHKEVLPDLAVCLPLPSSSISKHVKD